VHTDRAKDRASNDSALVPGMVGVAQYGARCDAEPFRTIEHAVAVFMIGDDGMTYRVQQPLPNVSVAHSVIPRVFPKKRGIREVAKKF